VISRGYGEGINYINAGAVRIQSNTRYVRILDRLRDKSRARTREFQDESVPVHRGQGAPCGAKVKESSQGQFCEVISCVYGEGIKYINAGVCESTRTLGMSAFSTDSLYDEEI
jgi:hypothetical protein